MPEKKNQNQNQKKKDKLVRDLHRRLGVSKDALERYDEEQLSDYFSRTASMMDTVSNTLISAAAIIGGGFFALRMPAIGLPVVLGGIWSIRKADQGVQNNRAVTEEITSSMAERKKKPRPMPRKLGD